MHKEGHCFYRSHLFTSKIGINSLIAAADPIFTLAANLKNLDHPIDDNRFMQALVHEMRAFEQRAQATNYRKDTVSAAHYALCALLDETIDKTSWGKTNNWEQEGLLNFFYPESAKGNRFAEILEQALTNITLNTDLLELLYLCLSCGMHGPRDELYKIIAQYRHSTDKSLFVKVE